MSIVYIGMDVHTTTFTFCTFSIGDQEPKNQVTVPAEFKQVPKYIGNLKKRNKWGSDVHFVCGYEAGCLGYSLYKYLRESNIDCIILAPTTMYVNGSKIKTDKRDAENIARCLAFNTYSAVHVPTQSDEEIKEYIRMRDDHKVQLKKIKQQIIAFCHRQGQQYDSGSKQYWTAAHVQWLRKCELTPILREVLDEYLITYVKLIDMIRRLDERIEEFAEMEAYRKDVHKLTCFLGIKTYSALALITEISDFNRFEKAENFASFLGMVPGEASSGSKSIRRNITKTGNAHLRTVLIEAAQGFTRGVPGSKGKLLAARQKGNDSATIAFADKANERLRRKYRRMVAAGKRPNVAKTAVARELACFVWGMMTGNIV